MFQKTIASGSVPLTGENADLYFENKITGSPVLRDHSFTASLRALLGNRIGDGRLSFAPVRYDSPDELQPGIDLDPADNTLMLVYFRGRGNTDEVNSMIDTMKGKFDALEDYQFVEKPTQIFERAFRVYVWYSEKRKSAAILTGTMDIRKLHVLQICIPKALPWFFPDAESGKTEDKYTADERALLASFQQTSEKEYIDAITKLAQQYNMREVIIRKRLGGVTKHIHEIELSRAQEHIRDLESRISDYYREIESYLRDRENEMTRIYGLKARIKENGEGSDLMDYFLYNPCVFLRRVSGTSIYFTCSGYLENWDDDKAETTIEADSSFPYEIAGGDYGVDTDKFKNLLRAIFIDRSIRIRVYADYEIDLSGHVDTAHFDEHDSSIAEYMPNPHIEHYDCLGDYKRRILDCLSSGNTLEAFNYCLASSRSLNWTDYTVMSKFIREICNDLADLRCFELPDGSAVNMAEAMRWANS